MKDYTAVIWCFKTSQPLQLYQGEDYTAPERERQTDRQCQIDRQRQTEKKKRETETD